MKVIVLKGLASLPAKRFRSLAAVAWKTLHAFADHRKSASVDSTSCRGKPRNHADPRTPGPRGAGPGRPRTERARQQNQVRFPENGTGGKDPSAALPVWPSTQYARGSPARIRPESARIFTDRPPPGHNRHLAGKVCLKSNTSQHSPLRGSRPRGRQDHHMHAGAEPAKPRPACSTRRSSCSPGTATAAGAGTAVLQPGHGNRVEVMQVGMVSGNGP